MILTARRLAKTRSRTVPRADAEMEAERLRLDGWAVSIGPTQKTRATNRVKKQRADVIATHRRARRVQQDADDAVEAKRVAGEARTDAGRMQDPALD